MCEMSHGISVLSPDLLMMFSISHIFGKLLLSLSSPLFLQGKQSLDKQQTKKTGREDRERGNIVKLKTYFLSCLTK